MDEVAELSAWSAAAGIPLLSVYEKLGILKSYMPQLQELVVQKLTAYFGTGSSRPSLTLYAPNLPPVAPSPKMFDQSTSNGNSQPRPRLDLLLLSATDGRDTLVDLTRTLTEMAQSKKIRPKDITADLINTEIVASTAFPGSITNGNHAASAETPPSEPDLLIVFGPYVKLDGYPPWQIRLSEIFCVGGDLKNGSTRVEYQGFLRGLWKYAGAEMRFGT